MKITSSVCSGNGLQAIFLNPLATVSLSYPIPPFLHLLSLLRKAVEEAVEPSLAGITAYVSQDCTGEKEEPGRSP